MSDNRPPTFAGSVDLVLPEFDQPPVEPIGLLRAWFDNAVAQRVREPGVLALATAGGSGRTTARMVQVLSITDRGVVFTSHAGSRKGRDIDETGWASGVLYWRETRQQVVFDGRVTALSEPECDALWAARPPATHPMSVASEQSAPLADEEVLRAEANRLAASGQPLPRPAAWLGYHLVPSMVEFWHGSLDRLHRRLRYDRSGEAGWTSGRLQP